MPHWMEIIEVIVTFVEFIAKVLGVALVLWAIEIYIVHPIPIWLYFLNVFVGFLTAWVAHSSWSKYE